MQNELCTQLILVPGRTRCWCGTASPLTFAQSSALVNLTLGSAEGRRAFLDRLLIRLDAVYASALATYARALASRNRLLKQPSPSRKALSAYAEILAAAGAVIGQARAALCAERVMALRALTP